MKKFVRQIVSYITALLMVLCTATPALAAGDGSISIVDAGSETYSAFKIFDVASTANDDVIYSISSSSPWFAKVYDANDEKSLVDGLEFTQSQSDNTVYTVQETVGFDAASFALYLKDNIPQGVTPVTQASGSTTIEGLDYGYYLVLASSNNEYQNRGMLVSVLDSNVVTIQNKNDMPLDKTYEVNNSGTAQKEGDVQVGDVLTYTITGKVPNTDGYESYAYVLTDTMTEGLTFDDSSFMVMVGNTDITDRLQVLTNENALVTGSSVLYYDDGFKLSLDMLNPSVQEGDIITVTYAATVNDAASCQVSENKAVLKYSNNPNDISSFAVKDSETTSYTSRILVDKFETGAPEQKIAGAKFVLRDTADATANSKYYYYDANLGKVMWVQAQSADVPSSGITVVTTDTNGAAMFEGLADGTYYLVETEAPTGYTAITEAIEIVVDGSASTTVGISADQVALALTKIANVANTPGSLLPSTGGMGTVLIYVASAGLLAVIVMRVMRRRQVN